jgi:hypothetical protein
MEECVIPLEQRFTSVTAGYFKKNTVSHKYLTEGDIIKLNSNLRFSCAQGA